MKFTFLNKIRSKTSTYILSSGAADGWEKIWLKL
jgi:hypothetical protein